MVRFEITLLHWTTTTLIILALQAPAPCSKLSNYFKRAAQQLVEDLRRAIPNVNLSYYLSAEVLRDLEKATGMKLTSPAAGGIGSGGGGVNGEEIGEEVVGE